jgi:hypothetical protein
MDFTFGIITGGYNDEFIKVIIESIYNNKIPNFEIIIVGHTNIPACERVIIYDFNENIKPNWITKKKNIICEHAKYENIVLLHDYIKLQDDWYEGFLKFGNDFHWCVNKIINFDGTRFKDYTLFPYRVEHLGYNYTPGDDIDSYFNDNCLLPYDFDNNHKTNKYMYISGSYYVIKKQIAVKYNLNEELVWAQGEDVELSNRLHNSGIIIKCNQFSGVKFLKYKHTVHWEKQISDDKLKKFIAFCNNSN